MYLFGTLQPSDVMLDISDTLCLLPVLFTYSYIVTVNCVGIVKKNVKICEKRLFLRLLAKNNGLLQNETSILQQSRLISL